MIGLRFLNLVVKNCHEVKTRLIGQNHMVLYHFGLESSYYTVFFLLHNVAFHRYFHRLRSLFFHRGIYKDETAIRFFLGLGGCFRILELASFHSGTRFVTVMKFGVFTKILKLRVQIWIFVLCRFIKLFLWNWRSNLPTWNFLKINTFKETVVFKSLKIILRTSRSVSQSF